MSSLTRRRELMESLLASADTSYVPDIVVGQTSSSSEEEEQPHHRFSLSSSSFNNNNNQHLLLGPPLSTPRRLSEDNPSVISGGHGAAAGNNTFELSSIKIDRQSLSAGGATAAADSNNSSSDNVMNIRSGIFSPRRIKTNYVDEQDEFTVGRSRYPDGRYCVISRQYLPKEHFQKNYQITISNFDVFQMVLADYSDIETLMWKKTTGQYNENDEKECCMVMCHVSDIIYECFYNRHDYSMSHASTFKKDKKVDHEYYQSKYHKNSERTKRKSNNNNTADEYFQVEDITCKQFSKNCCYALLLIISIFIFLLVASVPIWLIEGSHEAQILNEIARNHTNPTTGSIGSLVLNDSNNNNETIVTYDLFNIERWYYTNCLYFSTVTFTTVGYGDVVPQTVAGKLFVVLFGILGLATIGAMTGVLFKKLMQNTKSFLTLISNIIIFFIKLGMSCSCKSTHRKTTRIENTVSVIVKHPMSQIVYFLFLVTIYSVLGAAIFLAIEDWSFADSLYFVFITLTTIGYGDLKLKQAESKFFLIFFIICGIGLLGILLALIGGVFKRLLKKFFLVTTSQRDRAKNDDFLNVNSIQDQPHVPGRETISD